MDAIWLPKRPSRRDALCAQACGFGTYQRDPLEIQDLTLMEATPYAMTLFHESMILSCKVLSSRSGGLLITPIATHDCT